MLLSARFNEALQYAAELHARQVRKVGGQPYLSHLLAVAAIVLDYGGNEDEAIAALLHDAVEDQGGAQRAEEIRLRFGEKVAAIVEGCSDTDTSPKYGEKDSPIFADHASMAPAKIGTVPSKPPWQERKAAFLARLEHAPASIQLVVAADKLHNVRCLLRDLHGQGEEIWKHFKGGREKTLWYYRAVVDILKKFGPTPLVEELDRAVTELQCIAAGRDSTLPKPGNSG